MEIFWAMLMAERVKQRKAHLHWQLVLVSGEGRSGYRNGLANFFLFDSQHCDAICLSFQRKGFHKGRFKGYGSEKGFKDIHRTIGFDDVKMERLRTLKNSACDKSDVLDSIYLL